MEKVKTHGFFVPPHAPGAIFYGFWGIIKNSIGAIRKDQVGIFVLGIPAYENI